VTASGTEGMGFKSRAD